MISATYCQTTGNKRTKIGQIKMPLLAEVLPAVNLILEGLDHRIGGEYIQCLLGLQIR